MRSLSVALLGVIVLPHAVSALSVEQGLGYLDIFVGVFVTASLIIFGGALIVYFTRYGTIHREEAFPYMQGAIAILFTLSVILGLVEYFQTHENAFWYTLSVIVAIAMIWFVAHAVQKSGESGGDGDH